MTGPEEETLRIRAGRFDAVHIWLTLLFDVLNHHMKPTHPSPSPWASGPGEILRHGLEFLPKDTDTNRRLAMILIDNAVELMVKTYLGLPKRVSGLSIARNEFSEISESFPALLDAVENYAPENWMASIWEP